MNKQVKKRLAFVRIKAGLENAIAHARWKGRTGVRVRKAKAARE